MVLIVVFQQVYKRKTEAAKKEYLKALAAYRASLVSKVHLPRGRQALGAAALKTAPKYRKRKRSSP